MTFNPSTLLLSVSLFFYLLAKQGFGYASMTSLQALGMMFLILAAAWGRRRPPTQTMLVLMAGSGFLLAGWAISSGPIAGLLHAFFILLSFPLALSAAQSQRTRVLFVVAVLMIACFCLLGLASGEVSVSYYGDTRSDRWVLGFSRPTFLSEAMVLTVMALYGIRGTKRYSRILGIFGLAAALSVLVMTGSRAGLGAALLFIYMAWESKLFGGQRLMTRVAALAAVTFGLVFLASAELDLDKVNTFTTGRFGILLLEVSQNLRGPVLWLLGNPNAQTIAEYSTGRSGFIYHFDSFYGERLVSSGLLGLGFIVMMTLSFMRAGNRMTRAAIVAVVFYGIFENGVFNITSGFAAYTLVFGALLARLPEYSFSPRRQNHPALQLSPKS